MNMNEHVWNISTFLHSEWFGLGHYPLLSFFGGGNACRLTFPLQTSRTKNSEAPISRCLVLFICLKFVLLFFLFFPSLFYFSNGFPSMLQSFWRIYVGIVLLGSICGRCEFEDQNRINKVSMWFCVKSCVSVCYKLENVVVFVISFQKNGRVFPIKTFDLFWTCILHFVPQAWWATNDQVPKHHKWFNGVCAQFFISFIRLSAQKQ